MRTVGAGVDPGAGSMAGESGADCSGMPLVRSVRVRGRLSNEHAPTEVRRLSSPTSHDTPWTIMTSARVASAAAGPGLVPEHPEPAQEPAQQVALLEGGHHAHH